LVSRTIFLIFAAALLGGGCAYVSKNWSSGSDFVSYNELWWKPIAKEDLASWEIAPQDADRSKNEVILSKRNELGQFSNLQYSPFVLDGVKYASVEALWQSLKFPEISEDERNDKKVAWKFTRDQVRELSGFEAKKAGDHANENMKSLGITWVTYNQKKMDYSKADQSLHYELIFRAIEAKLQQNPQLLQLLARTKGLTLLPDHKPKENAPPAYKYNEIYMKLRDRL
jgi:hypothetical protein